MGVGAGVTPSRMWSVERGCIMHTEGTRTLLCEGVPARPGHKRPCVDLAIPELFRSGCNREAWLPPD